MSSEYVPLIHGTPQVATLTAHGWRAAGAAPPPASVFMVLQGQAVG
jgi:hypothetical protein